MPVTIASTLICSVNRLDPKESRRIWSFIEKFSEDPSLPGISLERVHRAKDQNIWAGRLSGDLRVILHRNGSENTLLYAGHHDEAYAWAERRRIEKHIITGATQIVEMPEVIVEQPRNDTQGLFDSCSDDYLLSLGLPPSWLPAIRIVKTEDHLLDLLSRLPEEVSDRLMRVGSGEIVTPPVPVTTESIAEHPENRSQFFVIDDRNDLLKLLAEPFSTWVVFLHPSQERLAKGSFNGPLKITGSAGTGKTVVALHRARHLAKQGRRVLLTTYVTTLCNSLRRSLRMLCSDAELSYITVSTVHNQAMNLLRAAGENPTPAEGDVVKKLIERHASGSTLSLEALQLEWERVIQQQEITTWEQYRTAPRTGRGTPLSVQQRKEVWEILSRVQDELKASNMMEWPAICQRAYHLLTREGIQSGYDSVIVDEVQDLRPQEIRLLAALAGQTQDGLTLLGDGGQRIYTGRFTLKSLGINVQGRSHVLKINYRTTEQIRRAADRVAGLECDDLDGGSLKRATRSLFGGPEPVLRGFNDQREQLAFVVERIRELLNSGSSASEIAVFARKNDLITQASRKLTEAGIPNHILSKETEFNLDGVTLGTMHRAKGLEFKIVFVIDVSSKVLPASHALKKEDPQAREEALELERQLLYVSMTRARDQLFLTWTGEPSPYLKQ